MTNSLHRKKYGLAYVLTLILSGVFLLNILCGFGLNLTHHEEEASSHHSDEHKHDGPEHSGDHDHGTSGDDNCCDDLTAQFFSQLIKEKAQSYNFQSPKVVLAEHMLAHSTGYLLKGDFDQLQYYNNLPPPFQDCDKHVLFQVFLI